MVTLYAYVGAGYVVANFILNDNYDLYMLVLLYFIISAVFVSFFLVNMNKKLKSNDRL